MNSKSNLSDKRQVTFKIDCLEALQKDLQSFIENIKFCRDNEDSHYAKVRLIELTKTAMDLKIEISRLQQSWEVHRNNYHKDPMEDHFKYVQTQMSFDWF